jgi:hypothetical protein
MEQEPADDEDDAARNMRYFSESVIENFEDVYEELKEKLRSKLAEGGYSAKTPFDREKQGMSAMELDNWKIWQDGPKMEFWFKRGKNDDTAVLNSGGDLGSVPNVIKMWGFDEAREGHMDGIYRKMFGSPSTGRPLRVENDDLSRNMARNLEKLYSAQEAPAAGQQPLALGAKYEAPAASIVLAKDSRFIIMPETTLKRDQYPTMLLNWKYEIGVGSRASPEEVEVVKDIVKYFNEHPDMVEEAAAETIRASIQGLKALADATKSDVMSGKWPQSAIQHIDSRYGAAAMSGSNTNAERIIMITTWIKENFDKMGEVERWVAWYKFLKPLKEGYFNIARHGEIEMDDNANLGRPRWWKEWVQDQMKKLGTWDSTVRNYAGVPTQEPMRGTLGEPQAVGESMEEQIERIDRMLSEEADVRLYSMELTGRVDRDRIGQFKLLTDEIRGIVDVTTVTIQSRTDLSHGRQHIRISLKFKLLGQDSRKIYVMQKLIPKMNKIEGLEVGFAMGVDWSIPREITPGRGTKIQEAAVVRSSHPSSLSFNTPRDSLNSVVADWAEGGVMAYDTPMDADSMRYHVMMPVEELIPLCDRQPRSPEDIDDGMYQDFIANGAQMPIYIAIGMDGKVKITGNEDIVRYAERSGLEEVPVFFSYQRQI